MKQEHSRGVKFRLNSGVVWSRFCPLDAVGAAWELRRRRRNETASNAKRRRWTMDEYQTDFRAASFPLYGGSHRHHHLAAKVSMNTSADVWTGWVMVLYRHILCPQTYWDTTTQMCKFVSDWLHATCAGSQTEPGGGIHLKIVYNFTHHSRIWTHWLDSEWQHVLWHHVYH